MMAKGLRRLFVSSAQFLVLTCIVNTFAHILLRLWSFHATHIPIYMGFFFIFLFHVLESIMAYRTHLHGKCVMSFAFNTFVRRFHFVTGLLRYQIPFRSLIDASVRMLSMRHHQHWTDPSTQWAHFHAFVCEHTFVQLMFTRKWKWQLNAFFIVWKNPISMLDKVFFFF